MKDENNLTIKNKGDLSTLDENLTLQQMLAKDCIQTPDKKDGFNNIAELFKIMSASYGDNWNRQFENDAARDVWSLMLWERDKRTILDAIKVSFNTSKRFPPNLVEFSSICDELELKSKNIPKVETIYKKLNKGSIK